MEYKLLPPNIDLIFPQRHVVDLQCAQLFLYAGTKMGFFGFKYTIGTSTGISSVNAAAAKKNGKTYNMAGQEVSSSAKGLIIKNGKKYVK